MSEKLKKERQQPLIFKNLQPRAKPLSPEKAIEILIGAGIKFDKKEKTFTWQLGRLYSKKVIKAAHVVDNLMESNGNQTYSTRWLLPQ